MPKTGSASDELESIALMGQKGGEVEVEAGDNAADDTSDQGTGGAQEEPQVYKVLDRDFSSPEELRAEAERANKEILRMKQEQAEARKMQQSEAPQPKAADSEDDLTQAERAEVKRRLQEEYGLVDKDSLAETVAREVNMAVGTEKIKDSLSRFVAENDGSNGKPKADYAQLLETMAKHNFTNPGDAYFLMHREALTEAMAKEVLEKKPKGRIFSENSSPARTTSDAKPVRYNDLEARQARRQNIIERHYGS